VRSVETTMRIGYRVPSFPFHHPEESRCPRWQTTPE